MNPGFTDYILPTVRDVPPVECVIMESNDPLGPFGAKSCSEIAVNGGAPAIAVAIHDAVGIWMRHWPFTPENVLAALRAQGS